MVPNHCQRTLSPSPCTPACGLQDQTVPVLPTQIAGMAICSPESWQGHLGTPAVPGVSTPQLTQLSRLPGAQSHCSPLGELSSPTPRQHHDFSPGTSDSPSLTLTPSLGDVAKGPTTEMAALTPVPVSYSSALAPGPGSDSLAGANHGHDPAEPSRQATGIARAQQDGRPHRARTRSTHWIPARFGSQTPDLIISGLVSPGSSLGEEFGVGREGGEGEETSQSKWKKG